MRGLGEASVRPIRQNLQVFHESAEKLSAIPNCASMLFGQELSGRIYPLFVFWVEFSDFYWTQGVFVHEKVFVLSIMLHLTRTVHAKRHAL